MSDSRRNLKLTAATQEQLNKYAQTIDVPMSRIGKWLIEAGIQMIEQKDPQIPERIQMIRAALRKDYDSAWIRATELPLRK